MTLGLCNLVAETEDFVVCRRSEKSENGPVSKQRRITSGVHTLLGPGRNADSQQGHEQQMQGAVPHFGRDGGPGERAGSRPRR